MDGLATKNTSASSKFSSETLKEGIKPKNIEMKAFGYRENSVLIAQFGVLFRHYEIKSEPKPKKNFELKRLQQM